MPKSKTSCSPVLNSLVAAILVAVSAIASSGTHAATTGTLEPGQAEARAPITSPVELPTTWTSPKQEFRAVWLTSKELLAPKEEVLELLDALKAANFNTVLPDIWFRGYVLYPDSAIATQYPEAMSMPPVLEWFIPEAKKRGLKVQAWPEYGFYAYFTKDSTADTSRGALLDRHPHLTAIAADGSAAIRNPDLGDFFSLCPANPESHQLLASLYSEFMTRYDFDGINLDRMRFPSADYCHCAHCKSAFKADTGTDLGSFAHGTSESKTFLDWKRKQNLASVKTIVAAVKKARPSASVSAYVVGPDEMADKAQSWDLWVQNDLVDGLAVSMYGGDIRSAAGKAIALLQDNKHLLIAALNSGLPNADILLRNIGVARAVAPMGQFIWYAGTLDDDLQNLQQGPYSQPAEAPF